MRNPDFIGRAGQAWKAPPEAQRAQWPASRDAWLLHVPDAHPWWSWYVLSSCSLADIIDLPPAKKVSAAMTHEVLLCALDPKYHVDDTWCDRAGKGRWSKYRLKPANLIEQIPDFQDAWMSELVTMMVHAFVAGEASPDADFRSHTTRVLHAHAERLRAGN